MIFDGEKDPVASRRSNNQRTGRSIAELITPGPRKEQGMSDKVVLGVLGTVLIASILIAVKTAPKEIVLLTPMDAPLVNPPPRQ